MGLLRTWRALLSCRPSVGLRRQGRRLCRKTYSVHLSHSIFPSHHSLCWAVWFASVPPASLAPPINLKHMVLLFVNGAWPCRMVISIVVCCASEHLRIPVRRALSYATVYAATNVAPCVPHARFFTFAMHPFYCYLCERRPDVTNRRRTKHLGAGTHQQFVNPRRPHMPSYRLQGRVWTPCVFVNACLCTRIRFFVSGRSRFVCPLPHAARLYTMSFESETSSDVAALHSVSSMPDRWEEYVQQVLRLTDLLAGRRACAYCKRLWSPRWLSQRKVARLSHVQQNRAEICT